MNNFTFSKILWRIQDLLSGRSPELQSHCEAFPKLSTLCKQQLSVLEIRSRRVLPEPSQPQPWQRSGVPPVIRTTGASREQLWGAEAALGKPSPAARPPSTATADPPAPREREEGLPAPVWAIPGEKGTRSQRMLLPKIWDWDSRSPVHARRA